MKKIMFMILFCIISNYINSQTVVKLALPDNCKAVITNVINNNEDAGSKIEITPNPSSGIITLAISFKSRIEKATLGVYDTRGKSYFIETIFCNSNKLVKQLNLTGLQPGIYIFNVKNDHEVISTKLVISK